MTTMTTKARVDRVAYIGWLGVEGCEVIDLDSGPLTGFVGPTGAGKSTLAMCLDYALLPDRKALDIRPISEVKDARKAGADMLAESIDPRYGYAYVALDVTTRTGGRLIAGIYVEPVDGNAELTRWLIRDPKGINLYSVLTQQDGEEEFSPAFQEFKRNCAGRGLDVSVTKTVGEYCQGLYEAGILPSGMSMGHDRSLYASLIETTFKGGVSSQVVSRLKDYLLPEATQVSDIVSGLQTCTNEVVMTKNEIASAEKELTLLQSTYGVGKEIVLHSLRWMKESTNTLMDSLRRDKADMTNICLTHKQLEDDIPRIGRELEQVENSKKSALNTALLALREAGNNITELNNSLATLKTNLAITKDAKATFDQGKKQWTRIAAEHVNQSFEWVSEWFETHRKTAERKAFQIESEMNQIQTESNRLNSGMASVFSENLAELTGTQTLEKAFDAASIEDALAIELSLHGLTDGVIGMELENLEKLPVADDLPDIFWLGSKTPETRELTEVGDWYIHAAAGGYVATKKTRIPVFGSTARSARQKQILLQIDGLRQKHSTLTQDAEKLGERKTSLVEHKESITYYLAKRDNALVIEQAVSEADEALRTQLEKIRKATETQGEIEQYIQGLEKPYEEQLKKLRVDLNAKVHKVGELGEGMKKLAEKIAADEARLVGLQSEEASAKSILGNYAKHMFEAADGLENFDETRLLIEQTKRISALGIALQDEIPGRLAVLQDMDPDNRLSTLNLWPILMGIVRERVSIDCAELDSEDMIKAMKEHRADLGSKLVGHENEVRIKARNLHQTISSQVFSQKRKLDKLSKLGENITFGNVTGIRIVLAPRDEMLTVLEGFAEQLFSERKPVDVALKEWFDALSEKEGGISLTGDQLLDYRNYVDLSIEACRKASGWAPAASLSGGESIGSGLAIALMLARSIAAKGEIKVDQISPLFIVDEAHRLDSTGHRVVVDFAKREGFQVVVAAPELTPSYSCILYSLNRVFDPDVRLIIRGIKVAA